MIPGQGFAFKRKQKFKHDYNKLKHKERKSKAPVSRDVYTEEKYPEHLKHLYMAEEEKLKNEAWTHRLNRSKLRMREQKSEEEEEQGDEDAPADTCQTDSADPGASGRAEMTDSVAGDQEPAAVKER